MGAHSVRLIGSNCPYSTRRSPKGRFRVRAAARATPWTCGYVVLRSDGSARVGDCEWRSDEPYPVGEPDIGEPDIGPAGRAETRRTARRTAPGPMVWCSPAAAWCVADVLEGGRRA